MENPQRFLELSRFIKCYWESYVDEKTAGMARRKIAINGSMMIVAFCVRWSLIYVANILAFTRPRINSSQIHVSWRSDKRFFYRVTFSYSS